MSKVITKSDPMLDRDFLLQLDNVKNKEIFARVISLTFDEAPTEEIQGKVKEGSVNIDGSSAVRRSCNLTLVASEVNISDFYWGLNTKFKLYIGVKNDIDSRYDDIIWFKEGTYLITSFNTSLSTSGYTISISGKDKMCLLNGDVGGSIESISADFGTYDEIDEDGNITNKDYLLKDIILEGVHHYGKEPFQNIIIQDLDDEGLELMEYRGDVDLFLLFDVNQDEVTNMRFNDESSGSFEYKIYDSSKATIGNPGYTEEVIDISSSEDFHYDSRLTDINVSTTEPTYVYTGTYETGSEVYPTVYSIARITYGDTCGYKVTDLTYAGDLILSTGDKFTSVLDKIVSMLGEYEYFYNLEGQFIFRRKPTYVNSSWNTIKSDEDGSLYVENAAYNSAYSYSFTDSNLITSFQNTPDLQNLRNDFSIWGKKSENQNCHLRYAIDKKPGFYKNYNGEIFLTDEEYNHILTLSEEEKAILESTVVVTTGSAFKTTELPSGLSTDWWEIDDWARRYLYYADVDNINPMSYYQSLSAQELNDLIKSVESITEEDKTNKTFNYYVYQLNKQLLGNFGQTWKSENWLEIFPRPDGINNSYYYKSIEAAVAEGRAFWVYLFDTALKDGVEYIKSIEHGWQTTSGEDVYPTKSPGCSHYFSYALGRKQMGADVYYHCFIYNPQIPDNIKDDSTFVNKIGTDDTTTEEIIANYKKVDWREIIYQMSIDYYKYGHNEDFISVISQNNQDYYPTGYTGYEQYYTDMQGFWRYIYNPDLETMLINGTTAVDDDIYKYYIWDSDNKVFNKYNFTEATEVITVPENADIYFKTVTITYDDMAKLSITKDDQSIIVKETMDDSGAYLPWYSCYTNADNITKYYYLRDDIYQTYVKYLKYDKNQTYYNYGLALDLTKQSDIANYFYKNTDSDDTYIPGDKLYLNEYTFVGTVTYDTFENRTCQYYVLTGTDTYTEADTWTSSKEYYKKKTPVNFNKFGKKYYEYQDYVKSSNIKPGNRYYIKDNSVFKLCKDVKCEDDMMEEVTSGVTSKNYKNYYIKQSEPIFSLSTGRFVKDRDYYNSKNFNDIAYSNTEKLVTPDQGLYIRIDHPFGTLLTADTISKGTEYYERKLTFYDLTEKMFDPQNNEYFMFKDEYIPVTEEYQYRLPNEKYYQQNYKYTVTVPPSLLYKELSELELYYFAASDVQQKDPKRHYSTEAFNQNTTYYIRTAEHTVAEVTADNYEPGKYYKMSKIENSDGTTSYEWNIIKDKNYSVKIIYCNETYKYTPIKLYYDSEGNASLTEVTEEVTTYYYRTNDQYTPSESYDEDKTYYMMRYEYSLFPMETKEDKQLSISAIQEKYGVTLYYYKVSKDAIPEAREAIELGTTNLKTETSYYTRKEVYTQITLTEESWEEGKYYTLAEPKYDEATTFSSDVTYYTRSPYYTEYESVDVAKASKDGAYLRSFSAVPEDSEFDKDAQYYLATYSESKNTYEPNMYYQIEIRHEFQEVFNPTDKTVTYYNKDDEDTVREEPYDEVHPYFPDTYYISLDTDDKYITPSSYSKTAIYYQKNNSNLYFTVENSTDKIFGYFNDGIHNFYLKIDGKYVKQSEYNPTKKDEYYIEDFYTLDIDLALKKYEGAQYKDITSGREGLLDSTNPEFTVGDTYEIIKDGVSLATFTYKSNTTYYIYQGFVMIKDMTGFEDGIGYVNKSDGAIMYSDYKMYPSNIYYGYTKQDHQDLVDNCNEQYFYIKNSNNKYDYRRILVEFQRNHTYYKHVINSYQETNAASLKANYFNYYYIKQDSKYVSCKEAAESLYDGTPESLDKIYQTIGILFKLPEEGESRYAVIDSIDSTRTYYIKQCYFDEYPYLQYIWTAPEGQLVYLTDEFNPETYWTFDVDTPENLIFWFDFMDTTLGSELSQYGANSIGNRPKSVNDEDVKSIYYRDTPNAIFIDPNNDNKERKSGYQYFNLTDNIDNLFALSSQGKTAFDELDSFLQSYSYCTESITLNAIPVYYLEPNTRIFIYDEKSGINGEYLISKITLPLSYNGTMSIQATKAISRIY